MDSTENGGERKRLSLEDFGVETRSGGAVDRLAGTVEITPEDLDRHDRAKAAMVTAIEFVDEAQAANLEGVKSLSDVSRQAARLRQCRRLLQDVLDHLRGNWR